MERSDRIKTAYEYLRFKQVVSNQDDIARKMNRKRQSVSSALSGNDKYLTDKFIRHFCEVFSVINYDWLLTGEGVMLTTDDNITHAIVMKEESKGSVPFYGDLPVSAGQQDLATMLENQKPTGWINLPGMPASIGAFPVIGCSMEPDIKPRDFISIAQIDRWEAVDPDKIYMIITNDDRMIKHLAVDEESDEFLWCLSPNYPKFKVYKSDIRIIYRVTFHGRFT